MRRSAGSGFSFAELVIALAVLAVAVVPLFLMQGTAVDRARVSRSTVLAAAMASELAEQVRLRPFAALPIGAPIKLKSGPTTAAARRVEPSPGLVLAAGNYALEADVTIAIEPLDPPDALARLTLTVEWVEGTQGGARSYRHVELIENRLGVADAAP